MCVTRRVRARNTSPTRTHTDLTLTVLPPGALFPGPCLLPVQLTAFLSIAVVFSILGTNQGIYGNTSYVTAIGAGWLLLAMVNVSERPLHVSVCVLLAPVARLKTGPKLTRYGFALPLTRAVV